jgi:hypothetical protein
MSHPSNVFENEEAMLRQLEAMGMPRQMLANLTPDQKAAMFAMTVSPEIQQRAQERVAHEEDWKDEQNYQWKNTRDDVFAKFIVKKQGSDVADVHCSIEPERLRISMGNANELVDRPLFQAVNVDESTWEVRDNILLVSLRKAQSPMRWLALFR